jgi:hypothetical protein
MPRAAAGSAATVAALAAGFARFVQPVLKSTAHAQISSANVRAPNTRPKRVSFAVDASQPRA